MHISSEDLEAVRQVLSGKVSLGEVQDSYSPHHKTLVGVTIVIAGDDPTALAQKGTYGSLLENLASKRCTPRAYIHAGSGYDLIRRSHLLNLHRTTDRAGNNLSVAQDTPLSELLQENAAYQERAHEWYRSALERVRAERTASEERSRAYRARRDALRRMQHSNLLKERGFHDSPAILRELARDILDIVGDDE